MHVNELIANSAIPAQYGSRRDQAVTQQPAKRIPTWLTIDLAVILVSSVIIGIWIWMAP